MISLLYSHWDSFFHDKTGVQGCLIAGYLRSGFALIFLIDRTIQLFNLEYFFSPDRGVLPYRVSSQNYEIADWGRWSIFQWFPESNEFLWIFAGIGILQGIILLLGATAYPRLHLFGIYLNIMSFGNHNCLMWDAEDTMLRLWAIMFLFFPLNHCTIYDRFGLSPSSLSSSWPMWPFRIFQIEMLIVYMGASLGKFKAPAWQEGTAIYYISYGIGDYPGIFNPDFLYGRYGPLKLMAYTAMLLEGTCYISVWIPATRKLSIALMLILHIGIDLGMNMHMFEWLSILGWFVFLIQPTPTIVGEINTEEIKSPSGKKTLGVKTSILSLCKKTLTNVFVASFIISISLDSAPWNEIGKFLPTALKPARRKLMDARTKYFTYGLDYYLTSIGLSQGGDWGMYTDVFASINKYRIDAMLTNGTRVDNIWRSPDWSKMSNWHRKFNSRNINYYGHLPESEGELLHLMELASKPFLEQRNIVYSLTFVMECKDHKAHKMESSTGGFWGPVVKHPMNVLSEIEILVARVGHCQDALSADTCARLIEERFCKDLLEQCAKSCLKDCDGSNFIVEYYMYREAADDYHGYEDESDKEDGGNNVHITIDDMMEEL